MQTCTILRIPMPRRITFEVFVDEYDNVSQLPVESQALVSQAREACQQAYAPYSNFMVGAAVLLDNGEIVSGSNQENASFPCGLCAERVTLNAAHSKYPAVPMVKLAVTAMKKDQTIYQPVTPCGACRQVISEYQSIQNQPIELIMQGTGDKVLVATSIEMLLPAKFSAKHMDHTHEES